MRSTVRVPVTEGSLQPSGTIAPHSCSPQSSVLLSHNYILTHKSTETKTVMHGTGLQNQNFRLTQGHPVTRYATPSATPHLLTQSALL